MDSGFKLTLRAALVLVILTGIGLVAYAVLTGSASSTTRPEESPAPEPIASAAEPEEPPEPAEAPPPAPEDPAPSPGGETELQKFVSTLWDPERDREDAVVEGDRAVLKEAIYEVFLPVVLVNMWPAEGEPLDVELEKVRVQAERAELDEEKGIVRLFGNVTATGEDFQIVTDSVVYKVVDRSLTSDEAVRIRKDKLDEEGGRTPALVVEGRQLRVDLAARHMSILKEVEATLYGVSQDFLAADLSAPAEGDEPREVVITSDGRLLYEHLAKNVNFEQNVHAVSGDRELRCDQLTILLGQTEEQDRLEVSNITATGEVELSYVDQVARGRKLEWHNVTQTGLLTGDADRPASMTTPEFEMTGERLTFYRVNDRFHAEGPGSLRWTATGEAAPDEPPDQPPGWGLGPLQLSNSRPVRVTWQTSMTYHVPDRVASFVGEVVAQQQNSSLSCEQLTLTLEPGGGQMRKVEAEGGVTIHEQAVPEGRDVLCDRLVWDAPRDTVQLTAAEGQVVTVQAGLHTIAAPHIVLDNAEQTLHCPVAGELTARPSPTDGLAGEDAAALEPIRVAWQREMHFRQRPAPLARFSGDVVASRAGQLISGQELSVEFGPEMTPVKMAVGGGAVVDVFSAPPGPASGGAQPAPDAAGRGASLLPGIAEMKGERWRLTCEEIEILVAEELITSSRPGSLSVLQGDVATGTITWERSLALDFGNDVARFGGNVSADVSGTTLKSEKLKLDFDEKRDLRHVWAEESVYFTQQREDAWELESQFAEAVFAANSQLREVIAREKVEVRDEQRVLNCQMMQLFLEKIAAEPEPVLQRAVAQQDVAVRYVQEERLEAEGDRLEWERVSDTYVLTGEPHALLRRGSLMITNDRILLDRPSGRMTLPPGAEPVRTVVPQRVP
jgi:lipopolysaccharide export system protein LptA